MKKWDTVTEKDAGDAISGTVVGDVCEKVSKIMTPGIPLAINLPKALAIAGALLAQPKYPAVGVNFCEARIGINNAKNVIQTGGGQTTNIYALTVATSGVGKDVGGWVDKAARHYEISQGTSGSAEGMLDAFEKNGAGLLEISEMQPYLKPKTWQHETASVMTQCFNKLTFKYNMSKGGKNKDRKSDYCCPSIAANIQPDIIARYSNGELFDSGFFQRFIIGYTEDAKIRVPSIMGPSDIDHIVDLFQPFTMIEGTLTPEAEYLKDVREEFSNSDGANSVKARLVNEYGPKIAYILGVQPGATETNVTPETWERAALLVKWFYRNAVTVFSQYAPNDFERERAKKIEMFDQYIRKNGPCMTGAISHRFSKYSTQPERDAILAELVAQQRIGTKPSENGKGTVYVAQ